MKSKRHIWKTAFLLTVLVLWICSATVLAEGASSDNSLSSLGILTEGATVSPEFYYSTIEYNVTVPAGTQALELEPVTSNPNAWIVDITGKELVDGQTTVEIIVSAENGSQYSYFLYVKEDESAGTAAPAVQTEAETEPPTEKETEPETEDPRYVKVARNSLEEANKTITALKEEASSYRDRLGIMMKILYGLIGFCVILLFVVINLILKKKDLKAELAGYRGYGYPPENGVGGTPETGYQEDAGYAGSSYSASADGGNYEQEYTEPAGMPPDDVLPYETEQQEAPEKKRRGRKNSDDPNTVPKPSKAKKKAKKLPEYEETDHQQYSYHQPEDAKSSEDVEVTMIDL